jgi:hypothetical protein
MHLQLLEAGMRHPPLLTTSPDITAARATLLADNLFLQDPGLLLQVVLRAPALFSVPQVGL